MNRPPQLEQVGKLACSLGPPDVLVDHGELGEGDGDPGDVAEEQDADHAGEHRAQVRLLPPRLPRSHVRRPDTVEDAGVEEDEGEEGEEEGGHHPEPVGVVPGTQGRPSTLDNFG